MPPLQYKYAYFSEWPTFIEQELHFKCDFYTEYNICQTLHVKRFSDSKSQAVMPLIHIALILEK